jgi:hypothetical protein
VKSALSEGLEKLEVGIEEIGETVKRWSNGDDLTGKLLTIHKLRADQR